MKVILTQDVPKVGNRDEVLELSEGYAQNVLISKGKAILATPKALADLENRRSSLNKKKEDEAKTFSELISNLNDKKVIIKVKTNEKGNLFKSVGAKDVSVAIKESTGLIIEEGNIIMDHLKEKGSHKVTLKRGNLKGECEIIIESI